MDNLDEDIFFRSLKRGVKPRRRPRFNYIAGEVEHDRSTPKVDCCKGNKEFRVYHRDYSNLVPRGICCLNCDTEYLDTSEYESLVYDRNSEVEVACIDAYTDAETDNELTTGKMSNVERKSVVFRKKTSDFSVSRCVAFLSMVQPNRLYIDHEDPRVIEQLLPGDHITWHRSYTLWHHQLIRENKGNGKCDVIHFNPAESSWCSTTKGEVRFENDFDFTASQNDGTAYKILYKESVEDANPLKLVIDRANSRLLENNYSLFSNNCEHLITFCKTGRRKSVQSTWLFFKFLFLLMRFVILSIVIALIIFPQYEDDERIHHLEKSLEIPILMFCELVVFVLPIIFWHVRQHRKLAIGLLDRNRRIVEAFLEGLFTVGIYATHILFLDIKAVKDFISESHFKCTIHIVVAIGFLFVGKLVGCFAGHAIAMVLPCQERTISRTSRRSRAVYGTVNLL